MKKIELKYYTQLDGLRGIAALSVLVFHFFLSPSLTEDIVNIELLKKLTEVLQHGVTLFFVLSGFVISRILLNTKYELDFFTRFYKKRILRIFPLYYLYLIIYYYFYPWLSGGSINLEFDKQLPIFLFLQNLGWLTGWSCNGPGHFWSLAVEEHFYFVWPLVVFLFPEGKLKLITILFILISLPLKYYFLESGIDINYNTFSRYDSIMVGCYIAILEKKHNYELPILSMKRILFSLTGLFLFGIVIYIFQDQMFVLKSVTKHLILGLFFGTLIYVLLTNDYFLKPQNILNSPVLQYLGKISFGLYVWHMLAISICSNLNIGSSVTNFFITVLLSVILAHLSYFYFEKYFLRLK